MLLRGQVPRMTRRLSVGPVPVLPLEVWLCPRRLWVILGAGCGCMQGQGCGGVTYVVSGGELGEDALPLIRSAARGNPRGNLVRKPPPASYELGLCKNKRAHPSGPPTRREVRVAHGSSRRVARLQYRRLRLARWRSLAQRVHARWLRLHGRLVGLGAACTLAVIAPLSPLGLGISY